MTQKFKKVVKDYVCDGILTEDEINDLKRLAAEEKIEEDDAHFYINVRLKKRKAKLENPYNWTAIIGTAGTLLASVGGLALKGFELYHKGKK